MAKLTRLKFNDPAPDLDIKTADGNTIRLSSLWADKTVLLVFTRHYGCLQCKEMLDHILRARADIERAGLRIVAVTQGKPSEAAAFCKERAPGIICLADPERRAYRAYGLGRGNMWQVYLSPQVWRGTWRALWRGYRAQMPPRGQSVMQTAGMFIIGADGKIRMPYYYDTIADHPPTELLLRGVLGTSWTKPLDDPLA